MADRRRLKGWAAALAAGLIAAGVWSAFHPLRAAETAGTETDSPAAPAPGPDKSQAVTPGMAAPVPDQPAADQPPPNQPPPPSDQSKPEQSAPDQPNPPPPDKGEPPKAAPQPPRNLEPLAKEDTISVLGKKVRGPAGEDMGRVVDLLLDRDAQIQAVVIDFGGFLGVGSRKIAIDWRLVHFEPDNRDAPLALSLGKAEVQAAPEYKDTAQPPVMVGPPPPPPEPSPEPPPSETPSNDATR